MRHLALAAALLTGLSAASAMAQQPVRIMPLGDSITESAVGMPSYRYWLWQELTTGHHDFEFVGSRQGVFNCCPLYPPTQQDPWDDDHESYTGIRIDSLNKLVAGFVSDAQPDIVLLHIGTNDLNQIGLVPNQSVPSTLQELFTCIQLIRSARPGVVVLVAQVIPAKPGHRIEVNGHRAAYNAGIPAVCAALDDPSSPVKLVDMASGYRSALLNRDSLHPNAWGELEMAARWYEAMQPYLTRKSGAWWDTEGQACPAWQAERPHLVAQNGARPVLGSTFGVQITGIPPGAASGVGIIGVQDNVYQGVSLPWDLSRVGLPGCSIYLAPVIVMPLAPQGSSVVWSVPIPSTPAANGLTVFFQAGFRYQQPSPIGLALTEKGIGQLGIF